MSFDSLSLFKARWLGCSNVHRVIKCSDHPFILLFHFESKMVAICYSHNQLPLLSSCLLCLLWPSVIISCLMWPRCPYLWWFCVCIFLHQQRGCRTLDSEWWLQKYSVISNVVIFPSLGLFWLPLLYLYTHTRCFETKCHLDLGTQNHDIKIEKPGIQIGVTVWVLLGSVYM